MKILQRMISWLISFKAKKQKCKRFSPTFAVSNAEVPQTIEIQGQFIGLNELGMKKFPSINQLKQEYAALAVEKKTLYGGYHKLKDLSREGFLLFGCLCCRRDIACEN
jgi:predicted transcriptional regulator